jgi:hypothetical protein
MRTTPTSGREMATTKLVRAAKMKVSTEDTAQMRDQLARQWERGLEQGAGLSAIAVVDIPREMTDRQARESAYRAREELPDAASWATRNRIASSPTGRVLEAALIRMGTRPARSLMSSVEGIPAGNSCPGLLEWTTQALGRVHWGPSGSEFYRLESHLFTVRCPHGCFEIQEKTEDELLAAVAAARGRVRALGDPGNAPFSPILCASVFS